MVSEGETQINSKQTPTQPTPEQLSDLFNHPPTSKVMCSFNRCPAGHEWVPGVILVKCPGCEGPVLAVRMENCPVCNEPTKTFSLRTDHITKQMGVNPLCKGGDSNGEVGVIEIERHHAEEWEEGFLTPQPIDQEVKEGN